MVELIVNDIQVELPKDSKIKFTKQISDIFDIARVSCSYTNSFSFDKTPVNSQAMQQLGVSGDSSTIPYNRNNAKLKINGANIVSQGWFNIQNTDSNYTGSVLDGMVDFFRAIENKTMGNDLDLSNFDHEKTLESVIASFTNQYYNYIIADYGGKLVYNEGINIDYLAPCFSVRKLWELIFSTFNFNCDYTNLSYIDSLYITYPKDVYETQADELIAALTKSAFTSQKKTIIAGFSYPTTNYFWSSSTIEEGSLIDNWKYVMPETTSYAFDLTIAMYMLYTKSGRYGRRIDVSVNVLKNGVVIGSIISNYKEGDTVGDERNLKFNLSCDKGDIIELSIFCPRDLYFDGAWFISNQWRTNYFLLNIYKTNLGTTTLGNELKDFLIKDFIKEIIWRTGLTPILNKETNTVEFITLDSRIDFDNAQDMSHTFVERTNETYTNDYAQKNIFKLKKNVDTDLTGDGYLYVYNRNIEDEKTLVQSKIYVPDKKIVTSNYFGIETNQYKIWETETKINDADEVEVSYKGLSGRFYFVRKQISEGEYKLISEKLVGEDTVLNIPIAINTDTLFEEAVYKNYAEYQKIFTNFRVHTILQALTENDFLGLDLTKPVFFKQENAYYICNKIPYEEGEKSLGEYIKINKV